MCQSNVRTRKQRPTYGYNRYHTYTGSSSTRRQDGAVGSEFTRRPRTRRYAASVTSRRVQFEDVRTTSTSTDLPCWTTTTIPTCITLPCDDVSSSSGVFRPSTAVTPLRASAATASATTSRSRDAPVWYVIQHEIDVSGFERVSGQYSRASRQVSEDGSHRPGD